LWKIYKETESVSSIFAVNSLVFQKQNLQEVFPTKLISDEMFETTMLNVEREAWIAIEDVISKFWGNYRDQNYKNIVNIIIIIIIIVQPPWPVPAQYSTTFLVFPGFVFSLVDIPMLFFGDDVFHSL
jgi:hypothetical protein